jgi:hypothetical protein
VQTTLAGIGEKDQPFAPYSPAYKEQIDSVGGKPRQVVDLRGLFYHKGQKRSGSKRNLGQGRRGVVKRAFQRDTRSKFQTPSIVSFRTAETRPQRGIIDPLSEMSLDLIKVESTNDRLTIEYEPREKDYMILHNKGDGKLPQRKWFTANKTAVRAAILQATSTVIQARVEWFNDHSKSGGAPTSHRKGKTPEA